MTISEIHKVMDGKSINIVTRETGECDHAVGKCFIRLIFFYDGRHAVGL